MYKADVIDTHCNICGNELSENDLQTEYAFQTYFGYGSVHDEEEQRIKFCDKCFAELLKTCKRPTAVDKYILATKPDFQNGTDPEDPVPGEFCNVCGGTINNFDLQEKIIIQAEYGGKKHRVQFCCACFDKIAKNCKHPSLIKDWGA